MGAHSVADIFKHFLLETVVAVRHRQFAFFCVVEMIIYLMNNFADLKIFCLQTRLHLIFVGEIKLRSQSSKHHNL